MRHLKVFITALVVLAVGVIGYTCESNILFSKDTIAVTPEQHQRVVVFQAQSNLIEVLTQQGLKDEKFLALSQNLSTEYNSYLRHLREFLKVPNEYVFDLDKGVFRKPDAQQKP